MCNEWNDVQEMEGSASDVLNCSVLVAAEGGWKHYFQFLFKCLIVSSELELALVLKQNRNNVITT